MESQRGKWNGNASLEDNKLARLRAMYDKRRLDAEVVQRYQPVMTLKSALPMWLIIWMKIKNPFQGNNTAESYHTIHGASYTT